MGEIVNSLISGKFVTWVRFGKVIRSTLNLFFSFEFFFALFLFAGVFKENPRLSWIPFDLTGISYILSGVFFLIIIYKRKGVVPRAAMRSILISALFFLWVCLSLSWSESWGYGGRKVIQLFIMGFWSYAGSALIIGGDERRLKNFFLVIVLLSIWMAGELIGLILSGRILDEWVFASNYLGFGRLLGLSVIILASLLLWGQLKLVENILLGALSIFLISVLMISGGRGPFLATLAVMLIPIFRDIKPREMGLLVSRKLIFNLSLLILVLVGFFLFGNRYFGYTTVDRILISLEAGGGNSARERIWLFEKAWTYFLESPIVGHGIGEFGYLIGWGDVRAYPHNMVLEILVELGLVGLVLFLWYLASSLKWVSFSRIRNDPWSALLLMLFLNAALNAMVSGDLPDNRMFFALLGLCAGWFSRPAVSHVLP